MTGVEGELLDWWTVPGERWGIEGLGFRVELRRDLIAEGNVDLGSFSEADLIAFAVDQWKFVLVEVVPVTNHSFMEMTAFRSTLEAVEFGKFTDSEVGRMEITDSPVRDLALDIVRSMRQAAMHVRTKPGSEFSTEKMTAPF